MSPGPPAQFEYKTPDDIEFLAKAGDIHEYVRYRRSRASGHAAASRRSEATLVKRMDNADSPEGPSSNERHPPMTARAPLDAREKGLLRKLLAETLTGTHLEELAEVLGLALEGQFGNKSKKASALVRAADAANKLEALVDAVLGQGFVQPDYETPEYLRQALDSLRSWRGSGTSAAQGRTLASVDLGAGSQSKEASEIVRRSISPPQSAPTPGSEGQHPEAKGRVFVVHGHDTAMKSEVARFLEQLGLDPVILDERPNQGATLIEKLEREGSADYAVILLSGDDIGRRKGKGKLKPRARQNVILEYGMFVGRFGRKRISVLYQEGVERPSDIEGIVYLAYSGIESVKLKLIQELQAAEFDVDANKAIKR